MHLYRRIIVTLVLTVISLFLMDKNSDVSFWFGMILLIISLLRLRSINRDFLKYEEIEEKKGGENMK